MPAPVISTYTSINDPVQGQYYEIQPTASNLTGSGDTWTASTLPAGMSINSATGLISGTPTHAGVYVVSVQVANGNGTSAALTFPIGVRPGTASTHSGSDLIWDIETGLVTNGLDEPPTVTAGGASLPPPVFTAKRGDQKLFYVRFTRGERVLDLGAIERLELAWKQREPEEVIVLGGGDADASDPVVLLKQGSGSTTRYLIYVEFAGADLDAALADEEADAGTQVTGLAELTATIPNDTGVGPSSMVRTSQSFPAVIVRDLEN